MRAVVFDLSLAKAAAAKALGRSWPALYDGPKSCLTLRDDVPAPTLPGSKWVRLAPIATGVCGSDLGLVYFKVSMTLSPYAQYPFVPGHEILARVIEVGADVRGVREGDRVAVDPWLNCTTRGRNPCSRCGLGEYATCVYHGVGPQMGMMLGACSELPGGWGEQMVAHESQLFVVSDSVSDDRAALTEPMAVGVHAAARALPRDGERVLILGGGAVAFAVLFALKELAPTADITAFAWEKSQAKMAETLGAARAWTPNGVSLLDRTAALTNAKVLRPMFGTPFLSGGFDVIFDCVGSEVSIRDSMAVAAGGGRIVMVGAAGNIPNLDLSHMWTKELQWIGTLAYANETIGGTTRRTYSIASELLQGSRWPIEQLVTHRFPLDQLQNALRANVHRGTSGAIKTLITL